MGGTKRSCPGCGAEMEEVFKGGITIDVCTKCGGAFFDFNELPAVLENTNTTADTSKEVIEGDDKVDHGGKALICAGCMETMTEKEYLYDSGVYINFCNSCTSVYLDKHELEEIKNFMTSLDLSEEGKQMEIRGTELADKANRDTEKMFDKLRKDIDETYWTDNLTGMNHVVNYIIDRFF